MSPILENIQMLDSRLERNGDGASVRNLGGPSHHVADVVAAIEAAAPEAAGTITFAHDVLLPLPEDMEAVRPVTTPLPVGVRETIELLRAAGDG